MSNGIDLYVSEVEDKVTRIRAELTVVRSLRDLLQTIKHCPFCKSDTSFVRETPLGYGRVICSNCMVEGPMQNCIADAIVSWNEARRKGD